MNPLVYKPLQIQNTNTTPLRCEYTQTQQTIQTQPNSGEFCLESLNAQKKKNQTQINQIQPISNSNLNVCLLKDYSERRIHDH